MQKDQLESGYYLHTEQTAPQEARPFLQQAAEALGKVPNLERVMATSPQLLQAYVQDWALFEETSLSDVEKQVVYQTANLRNGCAYCVPWHTKLSRIAGMKKEIIEALRAGQSLPEPKLEALRAFTLAVYETKGAVRAEDFNAFLEAGYSRQTALEVVLGLAIKLMSNFTNRLAGTPLDEEVAHLKWEPTESAAGR